MKPQNRSLQQSNSNRIEPLAVLPVFMDLHEKATMVIGASEGALWKAELLLQAGASVTLVCGEPTVSALQWASNAEPGRVEFAVGEWQEISFSDVALVIADVPKAEASGLAAKARAAGAIVNVVDQPAHSQFQFGSIVNKSPLVIGISTGGAAPVLAQLVRSLIETAVPEKLQVLAQRAKVLRPRINARLSCADHRRQYWNAFFSRAFGKKTKRQDPSSQIYSIMASDVGELTLRDLEMLRRAVRVYCRSDANPAIAALARREAIRETMQSDVSDPGTETIVLTIGTVPFDNERGQKAS
jgi:uroporphyrin-III C-methyltransferase / precorrin-2 dehydrogenase / sirohydrochlorin ferrochelatase